ncbi:DNA polymerase III subunit gamma/tau [Hartmannibacter diazotrophicus]|uniref:DNA polymerase III subunit gamma/tau n=1 Tax=Hartmannibacter diazotrophicus TaxID=1482074 RepID=A0A2C9DDI5_9HYPH|nr:DNA polymerase III subunit gamma/tau [Hartmannibacter diazotrophicus]SON58374.1 DNA polymerase III subunit gamma/tau [Hartmannibacter diazotrophicus]
MDETAAGEETTVAKTDHGTGEAGLGLDHTHEVHAAPAPKGAGYRVLARKYRPSTFEDLIGHGAMVRTLANAFETGRIAQAWMLTGVRGVGKTTTARILARALNYEIPGKIDRPTISMPEMGTHCQAIMEGRHVDVIEMDAASHTGVGDIREITDAARYKPVSARYKVYIIDEVHMLSTAAFNALLKTLEEPPEHVKFIFATTEIRKVPITVLSRCQRFDLRRIDAGLLTEHLKKIAEAEAVTVDDEALALIARAGEGSARDCLTIFDQAIAHGGGAVDTESLRAMLGLADRARIIDLFEFVMKGDVAGALGELTDQYDTGADPAVVLSDLAAFVHLVTRMKLVPASASDPSLSEGERTRGKEFSAGLSVRVLSRAWQLLLKGIAEVEQAARPLPAAEMVIVRLAYAADLPTLDEALKQLGQATNGNGAGAPAPRGNGGGAGAPAGPTGSMAVRPAQMASSGGSGPVARLHTENRNIPAPAMQPGQAQPDSIRLESFEAVVELAAARRDIGVKFALERNVRLVNFEDGRIEINPLPGANPNLAGDLGRKLTDWTGKRWIVTVSREEGEATIQEKKEAARRSLLDDVRADPLIADILSKFPGAEIVDVQVPEDEISVAEAALPVAPDDVPFDPDDPFDPDAYDLDAAFGDPVSDFDD